MPRKPKGSSGRRPGPLWEMPKNQNSPNSSTMATTPTWLSRGQRRDQRGQTLDPALRGGLPVGVGRADTGGNPGSVGDKFAFGNTHTTGQGYVKSQRGHYHDGIFCKRNKFNLLLHETFLEHLEFIRRWLLAASSCKDQPPCAQGSTLGR